MKNDSDPKTIAKCDNWKIRPSLVPTGIIKAISVVREYGTKKYNDPNNWKTVEIERYHEAMLRHILSCWNDLNAIDPESGLPHLWHAACNMAFIIEMKSSGGSAK